MSSLAAAAAWVAANASTIGTIGALGAAAYGGVASANAQKDASRKQEKLAKMEMSKAPESQTQQKKIDAAAKFRSSAQNNLLASARSGSTATGGTALG